MLSPLNSPLSIGGPLQNDLLGSRLMSPMGSSFGRFGDYGRVLDNAGSTIGSYDAFDPGGPSIKNMFGSTVARVDRWGAIRSLDGGFLGSVSSRY